MVNSVCLLSLARTYTRDSKLFPIIILDLGIRVHSRALQGPWVSGKHLGCSEYRWVTNLPRDHLCASAYARGLGCPDSPFLPPGGTSSSAWRGGRTRLLWSRGDHRRLPARHLRLHPDPLRSFPRTTALPSGTFIDSQAGLKWVIWGGERLIDNRMHPTGSLLSLRCH